MDYCVIHPVVPIIFSIESKLLPIWPIIRPVVPTIPAVFAPVPIIPTIEPKLLSIVPLIHPVVPIIPSIEHIIF